jgi:hypothetical protein
MVIFIMNDDLESMWKEAVGGYFKILCWYLPAGVRKTARNL